MYIQDVFMTYDYNELKLNESQKQKHARNQRVSLGRVGGSGPMF